MLHMGRSRNGNGKDYHCFGEGFKVLWEIIQPWNMLYYSMLWVDPATAIYFMFW